MDKCPNCGNKLSKMDVLCQKCGSIVEVIQIKGNISVASETIANSTSNKTMPIQKKEIPQSFIVYDEDFPPEGSGDMEPAILPDTPVSDTSENTDVSNAPSDPGTDIDFSIDQTPVNSIRAKLLEKESLEEDNPSKKEYSSFAKKDAPVLTGEDENDYSPRYLENLKKLNLPEIEDINNFDPEEYMREYKYKKNAARQSGSDDIAAPAKKQWLEIEEADPLAADLVKVREDVRMQAQPLEPPAQQPVERRYKGVQESRAAIKSEPTYVERKQPAVKNKKPVKHSALITFLFWIIVSAAILFSCIFFDNYVKTSFGTYDNFIYSITNGQIDIDPDKP